MWWGLFGSCDEDVDSLLIGRPKSTCALLGVIELCVGCSGQSRVTLLSHGCGVCVAVPVVL